jgi:transposase
MRNYSVDLRERVIQAYDRAEGTQAKIAKQFGVSRPWVTKLVQRRRETGSVAAKPHGGGQTAKFVGEQLQDLKNAVSAAPDATLQELLDGSGVKASIMAVQRALVRLGCRRKKSRCVPPSRIVRMCKSSGRCGGRG